MFIWDFVANPVMESILDWFYSQMVGFLGAFFAQMGNMGVELFDLSWVRSVVRFFSQLGWALFAVSVVVSAFECGIEYASGRGNLQQPALNALKGFFAVSLFTTVPVRLYALSVSLQGTFAMEITGAGKSIGELGNEILTGLEGAGLTDIAAQAKWGLGTNPIMLLFAMIFMAYAVIKVFFSNLKRGGILLIQIAVGSLYMFSIPRGYLSDQLLTKGNTVAALDELYLWLSNLTTIEYIRNCLKRVRKRNSALILASQNLEDFDIQGVRELTRPLFAIPTHQFLFHGGKVDKKFYMDNLQLESAEYDLISSPNNGVCLFKSGADRNLLDVHAPPHKHALITGGGG